MKKHILTSFIALSIASPFSFAADDNPNQTSSPLPVHPYAAHYTAHWQQQHELSQQLMASAQKARATRDPEAIKKLMQERRELIKAHNEKMRQSLVPAYQQQMTQAQEQFSKDMRAQLEKLRAAKTPEQRQSAQQELMRINYENMRKINPWQPVGYPVGYDVPAAKKTAAE